MSAHLHCPACGQAVPDLPRLDDLAAALALSGDVKRLFFILAAARGRFMSQEEIAEILWGDRADGGPDQAANVIGVHIVNLRRRLASWPVSIDAKGSRPRSVRMVARWSIETSHGHGYQLVKAAA